MDTFSERLTVTLTDEDLIRRLANTEDAFVERKLFSDSSDWLKTAVAFANSAPIGFPAILYIGVKNDGTPEGRAENLESIQKALGRKLAAAYPPIAYLSKALWVHQREVLAVIIPGSDNRPHFAGQAYVRRGADSVSASEEEFQKLLATRNSKAYRITQYIGKPISHVQIASNQSRPGTAPMPLTVLDCNQFYVILEGTNFKLALPLARVTVSFDVQNNRLQLEEHP